MEAGIMGNMLGNAETTADARDRAMCARLFACDPFVSLAARNAFAAEQATARYRAEQIARAARAAARVGGGS
jgi:hypothetical protein